MDGKSLNGHHTKIEKMYNKKRMQHDALPKGMNMKKIALTIVICLTGSLYGSRYLNTTAKQAIRAHKAQQKRTERKLADKAQKGNAAEAQKQWQEKRKKQTEDHLRLLIRMAGNVQPAYHVSHSLNKK